jgi:DNA-binding HxlR family transcriptional regulator
MYATILKAAGKSGNAHREACGRRQASRDRQAAGREEVEHRKHTHHRGSDCPINFALETFGDPWSLLLIRDLVYFGKHTDGEFFASEEGMATNILASRFCRREESYQSIHVVLQDTSHTSLPAGQPFASAEANPTRGSNVPKKERGKGYYLYETPNYGHYLGRR